MNGVNIVF